MLIEKRVLDYIILFLALLLYGINIYYLTTINSAAPKWDEAVHLRDSLVFYNVFTNPSEITPEVVKEIINRSEKHPLIRPSGYYPPLVPIVTSVFYFPFGTSQKTAVMSIMIYLFTLVFATYKIGVLMFGRNVALIASIIVLLFPAVLSHSVIYYLDLPLTAMVALSIFMMLKTEYFKNTTFSILSGFAFGLGMLTKWTFLFFTIGPLCYLLLFGFYSEYVQRGGTKTFRKVASNMILFVLASVAVFGPYYFPILPTLIEETLRYSHAVLQSKPIPLISLSSISFYPLALWEDMITPFGFAVFALGITLLSFSRHNYKTFILIWTIIPYLIFTFIIENKQPRYMMPWVVPISLVISYVIGDTRNYRDFGIPEKAKKFLIPLSLLIFFAFFLIDDLRLRNSIIMNSEDDWKIEEIVSVLESDIKAGKEFQKLKKNPKFLGVIPDHRYINGQTIRYYATRRRLPLNVIKLQTYTGKALGEFIEKFDRYAYILTKDTSNIAIASHQDSTDEMHNFFYSHRKQFEHLKTFHEPDGSEVSIFKRRP